MFFNHNTTDMRQQHHILHFSLIPGVSEVRKNPVSGDLWLILIKVGASSAAIQYHDKSLPINTCRINNSYTILLLGNGLIKCLVLAMVGTETCYDPQSANAHPTSRGPLIEPRLRIGLAWERAVIMQVHANAPRNLRAVATQIIPSSINPRFYHWEGPQCDRGHYGFPGTWHLITQPIHHWMPIGTPR